MRKKHEEAAETDLFYCFVDFEPEHPVVFVVPLKINACAIAEDHRIWLGTLGRNGQAHNDHEMRRVRPTMFSMPEGWIENLSRKLDHPYLNHAVSVPNWVTSSKQPRVPRGVK